MLAANSEGVNTKSELDVFTLCPCRARRFSPALSFERWGVRSNCFSTASATVALAPWRKPGGLPPSPSRPTSMPFRKATNPSSKATLRVSFLTSEGSEMLNFARTKIDRYRSCFMSSRRVVTVLSSAGLVP